MTIIASVIYPNEQPFTELFTHSITTMNSKDLNMDVNALIIWGGEDISPSIYNQAPASRYTRATNHLSQRDIIEIRLAKKAISLGIPIIGICRGAQLMCALAGGSLIQHVSGHGLYLGHSIVTSDDKQLLTNSVHHQMMNPFKVDQHELLAWCPKRLSKFYIGNLGNDIGDEITFDENWKESEIVWFPTVKALCIQGHPEYTDATPQFVNYTKELVEKYILETNKVSL